MKIFVVSLRTSTKRRGFMQEQLDRLKLPFEFIDAIEGSYLTKDEMNDICDPETLKKHPQWLNKGAIACALSHKIVYDLIVERNIPEAFIVEDDMFLPDNIQEILRLISEKSIPEEIVLLYFRSIRKINFTKDGVRNLNNKYELYFPANRQSIPGSSAGYYITLESCKKLTKIILPLKAASDSWKHYYQLGAFSQISVIYPIPIKDALFKSEIDYVGTYQGKFSSIISRLLDKYKVPILFEYLKNKRREREIEMTNFELINQPHPFQ